MPIPRHIAQAIVLSIIGAILCSQLIIGFAYRGKRSWPIIAYPMYRTPHFEGDRLDHDWTTLAIFDDGSQVEVERKDLGMPFWIFYKNIVNGILQGNVQELRPVAAAYCRSGAAEVTLEVRDLGVAIGRDGPVYGLAPRTLASRTVPCPGKQT